MKESYKCGIVLILLGVGFFLLFEWIRRQNLLNRFLKNTMDKMDEGTRQRLMEERKRMMEGEVAESFWHKAERLLYYSGLRWRYPFLSVEVWFVLNIFCIGGILVMGMASSKGKWVVIFPCGFVACEYLWLELRKREMNRRVGSDLPKFLDFLGNYSVTGSELCAILEQIAKYMDKPLANALEDCCREAEFTGDMSTALLYMREKIEHPQFKGFINELEVNLRYCADYQVLVQSGRRSLRDYLKASGERKGMIEEAAVNAALLLIMSFVSLLSVNLLIDESIWDILIHTLPGRISMTILMGILFLMLGKLIRNGE